MMDPELKSILAENRRVLDRLDLRLRKMEKRFVWGTVWTIVKIVIIVGPIVVGLIYFTPIINKYFENFKPIFDFYASIGNGQFLNNSTNSNTNQAVSPELLESFCNPQTREVIVQQMCK